MSKRRYSTVKCKRVDRSARAGQRTVFAVDVAEVEFVAALQVDGGKTRVRVSWAHAF
jgi:hypothetical protein